MTSTIRISGTTSVNSDHVLAIVKRAAFVEVMLVGGKKLRGDRVWSVDSNIITFQTNEGAVDFNQNKIVTIAKSDRREHKQRTVVTLIDGSAWLIRDNPHEIDRGKWFVTYCERTQTHMQIARDKVAFCAATLPVPGVKSHRLVVATDVHVNEVVASTNDSLVDVLPDAMRNREDAICINTKINGLAAAGVINKSSIVATTKYADKVVYDTLGGPITEYL